MTIFAIQTPINNPQLGLFVAALERVFPGAYYKYGDGQYVASKRNATSEQVAREMGATGEVGSFVVFHTSGYFGWHNKGLWEWLQAQGSP